MDFPVVLIKFRDYIFWFGPAYLVALLLGATTEVILRRALELPPAGGRDGDRQTQPEADLLPVLWARLSGSAAARQPLSLRLYIWLAIMSISTSWVALLMTAALSWTLSLLRIGIAFIFAAVLAALVPLVGGTGKDLQIAAPGGVGDVPTVPVHIEWWRALNHSFSKSSNRVIAGAVLGGALIGLTSQLYGFLHFLLGTPAAYLFAPVIATLTTLTPGTDAPLLAAMQVEELAPGLLAFMLAVSVTPFGLLRKLKEHTNLELKAVVAYVLLAWLLVAAVAWLLVATGLTAGVL